MKRDWESQEYILPNESSSNSTVKTAHNNSLQADQTILSFFCWRKSHANMVCPLSRSVRRMKGNVAQLLGGGAMKNFAGVMKLVFAIGLSGIMISMPSW